jgi:HD-like signal output (HDOD) protein
VDTRNRRWFGLGNNKRDGSRAEPVQPASGQASPPPAPRPAAEPDTPRQLTPAERDLQSQLVRVLDMRCDVLMRAAPAETRQSDAPMIIECLKRLDEAVIRQPPLAAQRALGIARNPMTGTAQLAAIFKQDPALAEALLQMANSSFYHRGLEPCVAIPEAIQRVGVRGVESIVTTHMVEGLLCKPGNAYAPLLTQVWGHMMRTAPIARTLAPAFKAQPEPAFTVGLLHDVGKLMIFDYLSQLRNRHRREVAVPERFLLDLLNRLHEPLGGIAALRWNLGADVSRAIAWHHHEPPPETPELLSELLCCAERAEHSVRLGNPLDVWKMWREAEFTADVHHVIALFEEVPGVNVPHDARDQRRHGDPPRKAA